MDPREALTPREAYTARFGAYVLDFLLALFIGLGIHSVWLAVAALMLVVFPLLEGFTGYSPGKALAGVKVVAADTTRPPGPVQGLIRGLLRIPDLIVGLFVSNRNEGRQRLGDKVAGAQVIGLPPSSRGRSLATLAYFVLLIGGLALKSTKTAEIIVAIIGPFLIAAALLLDSTVNRRAGRWWATAAALSLMPAIYMVEVNLCSHLGKNCPDKATISDYHKGWIVIALVAAAYVALRVSDRARDLAFPVLASLAALFMAYLLHDQHENFAMLLEIVPVAGGLFAIFTASRDRADDAAADRADDAAAASAAG